jgi:nicotinamide-nucleotide amidase
LRYNAAMNGNLDIVEQIAIGLRRSKRRICTAESCTGGLIAKSFTDLAGSSEWFERGFVTYSNEAKSEMLAVPASIIQDYGAVSEAVAVAMANGALQFSHADCSIAVTGVAGPGGGSDEKPVGTVWIAVADKGQTRACHYQFDGNREAVRNATLQSALEMALELINSDL